MTVCLRMNLKEDKRKRGVKSGMKRRRSGRIDKGSGGTEIKRMGCKK